MNYVTQKSHNKVRKKDKNCDQLVCKKIVEEFTSWFEPMRC